MLEINHFSMQVYSHSISYFFCICFLQHNFIFIQVLVPRTDIGVVSGKRKRVKREEMSAQQQQAQLLDINVEDTANPATVVKAFKVCWLKQHFC